MKILIVSSFQNLSFPFFHTSLCSLPTFINVNIDFSSEELESLKIHISLLKNSPSSEYMLKSLCLFMKVGVVILGLTG